MDLQSSTIQIGVDMSDQPREWWILPHHDEIYHLYPGDEYAEDVVHVIEHSAIEKMRRDWADAEKRLHEKYVDALCHRNYFRDWCERMASALSLAVHSADISKATAILREWDSSGHQSPIDRLESENLKLREKIKSLINDWEAENQALNVLRSALKINRSALTVLMDTMIKIGQDHKIDIAVDAASKALLILNGRTPPEKQNGET